MKTKEELKLYFENGDIPRQEDFWAWQDSYWHKDEKLDKSLLDLSAYEEFFYSSTDSTEVIAIGKRIIFPEGIKAIGRLSFAFQPTTRNYISHVTFPNTLEKIKASAFSSQYLTGTLRIPGSCKIIEDRAFASSSAKISKLILEDGVETIESSAFQFTSNPFLTSLLIPDSVKSVGENAFAIPPLQSVSAKAGLDLSKAGIPATATITYR